MGGPDPRPVDSRFQEGDSHRLSRRLMPRSTWRASWATAHGMQQSQAAMSLAHVAISMGSPKASRSFLRKSTPSTMTGSMPMPSSARFKRRNPTQSESATQKVINPAMSIVSLHLTQGQKQAQQQIDLLELQVRMWSESPSFGSTRMSLSGAGRYTLYTAPAV